MKSALKPNALSSVQDLLALCKDGIQGEHNPTILNLINSIVIRVIIESEKPRDRYEPPFGVLIGADEIDWGSWIFMIVVSA